MSWWIWVLIAIVVAPVIWVVALMLPDFRRYMRMRSL